MSELKPGIPGYTCGDLIGSGASAQVWKVSDADDHSYAAKVFDEPGADHGAIEWEALRRYNGPHVLEAIDWVLCPNGHRALIMQYASGGSLQEITQGRGGLTSGECVTALAPIAGALTKIHEDGFVHGDLTPRNIMFDSRGKPLLGDLGATRPISQPGEPEWGSEGFIAPELLEGEPPTAAADVYALGACAWFALTGVVPQPAVIRPHLSDVVPDVAPALAEFINAALVVSPGARPTMQQAHEQLSGAAHSAVVPLSTMQENGEHPSSMTLRLRAEAARSQERRGVHPAARRSSPMKTRVGEKPRQGSRRVKSAWISGLALAALAFAIPLGGHTSAHPYLTAHAVLHQPQTTKTVTPPSQGGLSLTASDVALLLNCRAKLWGDLTNAHPTACMATGSPAFMAENAALTKAQKANLRYTGLTFSLKSGPLITVTKPSSAHVVVTVLRSAYSVQSASTISKVASHQQKVEITLTRQKGQWLMTSWKGV